MKVFSVNVKVEFMNICYGFNVKVYFIIIFNSEVCVIKVGKVQVCAINI